MNLTNKTALITGSGQGAGLGIAKRLAGQGATVLINDLTPAKAEAAAQEIIAAGGKAVAAPFDVTNIDAVMAAVKEIEASVGSVDILVNNAGNAGNHAKVDQFATDRVSFRDMPVEHWQRYLGVNLYGVMNCTKAVLDGMCDRGWGRIVTITSEAGRSASMHANLSIYGVAKAGAAHLMRHLAQEVGQFGVTANSVSLGMMDNVPADVIDHVTKTLPIRRAGSADDAGGAVYYLVSEDGSWITGQTLVLNGGQFTF